MCYIANVGDSRSVLSCEDGLKTINLSRDHKPMDEIEYNRIGEAGGKIYQTKVQTTLTVGDPSNEGNYVLGPYRVLPGRLSVSINFLMNCFTYIFIFKLFSNPILYLKIINQNY